MFIFNIYFTRFIFTTRKHLFKNNLKVDIVAPHRNINIILCSTATGYLSNLTKINSLLMINL